MNYMKDLIVLLMSSMVKISAAILKIKKVNTFIMIDCMTIDNGILNSGLRNYIFYYMQKLNSMANRLCDDIANTNVSIVPNSLQMQLPCNFIKVY